MLNKQWHPTFREVDSHSLIVLQLISFCKYQVLNQLIKWFRGANIVELARRFLIPNNKLDDIDLNPRDSLNYIGSPDKAHLLRYPLYRAMDAIVYDGYRAEL